MTDLLTLGDLAVRSLALVGFGLAAVVAGTHAAVRRKLLNPFGGWPRAVRRATDPLLRPIETRLLTSGRNPQEGSLWLLGIAAIAGVVVVGGYRWLIGMVVRAEFLISIGPRAWLPAVIDTAISVVMLALLIRVLASWFGASHARWIRPLVFLTEWLVGPIRRRLPPFGVIDASPIAAYFVLWLAQSFLVPLLFRVVGIS